MRTLDLLVQAKPIWRKVRQQIKVHYIYLFFLKDKNPDMNIF